MVAAPRGSLAMASHRAASGKDEQSYPHHDLTYKIIAAGFRVHNTLGYGYLEPVYRRAMAVELAHVGIDANQEVPFELFYRDRCIGLYRADLVVEATVVVEIKTGLLLDPVAIPQALNYLKTSRLPIALVLHFGPRVTVKRIVASEPSKAENLDPPMVNTQPL